MLATHHGISYPSASVNFAVEDEGCGAVDDDPVVMFVQM